LKKSKSEKFLKILKSQKIKKNQKWMTKPMMVFFYRLFRKTEESMAFLTQSMGCSVEELTSSAIKVISFIKNSQIPNLNLLIPTFSIRVGREAHCLGMLEAL